MMKNLLKLLKVGLSLKLSLWRCRLSGRGTDAYRVAQDYQKILNALSNIPEAVQQLRVKTKKLQEAFRDHRDIRTLLANVMTFLDQLENTRENSRLKGF